MENKYQQWNILNKGRWYLLGLLRVPRKTETTFSNTQNELECEEPIKISQESRSLLLYIQGEAHNIFVPKVWGFVQIKW